MIPIDYEQFVAERRDSLMELVVRKFSKEEYSVVVNAYQMAATAHANQVRVTGEPYIIHPIAVARIVCEELELGVSPIIAALLHDVVEDTNVTIEDISKGFGDDVAFLVGVVTKVKKSEYEMSKQLDNFKQMLDSIQYDIRALLIKLADRLHNMRTLSSLKPDKQMRIASETDYFYAPLALRLGLYDIKSELENLSFRFRSPQEYEELERRINSFMAKHRVNINSFIAPINDALQKRNIHIAITPKTRSCYAIWRKMETMNLSFKELEHIYILNVVFPYDESWGYTEKAQALRLYSIISDIYKERPASLVNYIDSPKDNGYQALHVQFMSQDGNWVKLHICSERMALNSRLGCVIDNGQEVDQWVNRFREVLKDIAKNGMDGGGFLEDVVTTLYKDDILVFTPKGSGVMLPKGSSALDFAYEIHTTIGNQAKYSRINGKLSPVISKLKRGDRVEIGIDESMEPSESWLNYVVTYKAKKGIQAYLRRYRDDSDKFPYHLCEHCHPLPGDEVIGFKVRASNIMEVHKRNCPRAISLSAQEGDTIENVTLPIYRTKYYNTSVAIIGVDRSGLLFDLVQVISQELGLKMTSLHITALYEILHCSISLLVPSANELNACLRRIEQIEGVEEARRVNAQE